MTTRENIKTTRENIKTTISDLVLNFVYYDRKEDEELPVGAIEKAIQAGQISQEEIVAYFRQQLGEKLGGR